MIAFVRIKKIKQKNIVLPIWERVRLTRFLQKWNVLKKDGFVLKYQNPVSGSPFYVLFQL